MFIGGRGFIGLGMPKVVYRKLVKIGNSIYVSVPKEWVEGRELRPGCLVSAEVVDEGLLLKPLEKSMDETKKIKVKRIEGCNEQDVIRAYLAGYEEIEIEKPSESLRKGGLERLLNLLVGLEVVEDRGQKLVLHCFVKDGYDVRGVLSRMDSIARSMYVDSSVALESMDFDVLRSVRERDDRLDRLYFLAVRIIRSAIQSPFTDSGERLFLVDSRVAAKLLEEIGDEAEHMTYMEPYKGLSETAILVANCQEEAVNGFLNKKRGTQCKDVLNQADAWRELGGAWVSLSRIASLVQDLMQLV